jgi:hypothetical protein
VLDYDSDKKEKWMKIMIKSDVIGKKDKSKTESKQYFFEKVVK